MSSRLLWYIAVFSPVFIKWQMTGPSEHNAGYSRAAHALTILLTAGSLSLVDLCAINLHG